MHRHSPGMHLSGPVGRLMLGERAKPCGPLERQPRGPHPPDKSRPGYLPRSRQSAKGGVREDAPAKEDACPHAAATAGEPGLKVPRGGRSLLGPRGCYVVSSPLRKLFHVRPGPSFEDLEDLATDVAFEASLRIAGALTFADTAGDVRLRSGIKTHPDQRDRVHRSVQLTVSIPG